MWVNTTIRLGADPRSIRTKSGTPMTAGFGFADIGGESGFPLGLVCFNKLADELRRYRKGATLAVTGRLQANDYRKADGTEVHGYQLVLDSLAGVKRRAPVRDDQPDWNQQREAAQ